MKTVTNSQIVDMEILLRRFADSLDRMSDSVSDFYEVAKYLKKDGHDVITYATSFLGWSPRRKLNMEVRRLNYLRRSLEDIKAGQKKRPAMARHSIVWSLYDRPEEITESIIAMESLLREKLISEFGPKAELAYERVYATSLVMRIAKLSKED